MRVLPGDVGALSRLSELVERHVPPSGRIFAGERRHDALLTSPIRLYFLMGRLPAVRYQELHPAVADTEAVQREMVGDRGSNRKSMDVAAAYDVCVCTPQPYSPTISYYSPGPPNILPFIPWPCVHLGLTITLHRA